jgi:hypothetical protein
MQCVNVQTCLHRYFKSMLKNLTAYMAFHIMFSRDLVKMEDLNLQTLQCLPECNSLYAGTKSHHHRNHFLTIYLCLMVDKSDMSIRHTLWTDSVC